MLMFEYISFQTPSYLMQNMCTLHIQILLRLQYDKIDMNSAERLSADPVLYFLFISYGYC